MRNPPIEAEALVFMQCFENTTDEETMKDGHNSCMLLSIALSLKRIADHLENFVGLELPKQ